MDVGVSSPRRGEVFLVDLEPTVGREIKRAHPCSVVSPDELNSNLDTLLVAPMTTGRFGYAFRIPCRFQDRPGYIVLDQLCTVDRRRLVRRLGRLKPAELSRSLAVLCGMFAE